MKTKATKNFLTSGYKNIICIPAGALQTLLRYRDAAYYTEFCLLILNTGTVTLAKKLYPLLSFYVVHIL